MKCVLSKIWDIINAGMAAIKKFKACASEREKKVLLIDGFEKRILKIKMKAFISSLMGSIVCKEYTF